MIKLQLVYRPSGRAFEYAPLALNIYSGCNHNCKYCYVPGAMHKTREGFRNNVTVRKNMHMLEGDLKNLSGSNDPVFLCFGCDPYPTGYDSTPTRTVLEQMKKYDVPVRILTKSIDCIRDFDLLAKMRSEFGMTLTFRDETLSKEWEPNAASPTQRIDRLSIAKSRGIKTWASIEPVIIRSETIAIVRASLPFVDSYKIGKLNHANPPEKIDWVSFREEIIEIMKENNKNYYIKKDLAEII